MLATGFERELFRVGADGIASSFDSLTEEAGALIALYSTPAQIGQQAGEAARADRALDLAGGMVEAHGEQPGLDRAKLDRKSTRLNSSH